MKFILGSKIASLDLKIKQERSGQIKTSVQTGPSSVASWMLDNCVWDEIKSYLCISL